MGRYKQGCSACEIGVGTAITGKGLEYVAKIIINGDKAKLSKLRLCKECKNTLIKTMNEVIK